MEKTIVSKELLQQCLKAFNAIPNTKIKGEYFTTYNLASFLTNAIKHNEDKFFQVWSHGDIISAAEDDDILLTPEEVKAVAENITENMNANVGINWDTIKTAIEIIVAQREQPVQD